MTIDAPENSKRHTALPDAPVSPVRRVMRSTLNVAVVVIVAAGAGLALVLSHGSPTSAPRTVTTTPGSRAASRLNPAVFCSQWATVPLARSVGAPDLSAVAAIAPDDVWAVGSSGDTQGVAIHWDGSAWKRYPTPNLTGQVRLRGVAAASATDVWAVGSFEASPQSTTALLEHWDGEQWSIVGSAEATVGQQNLLNSVAVVTSSDVWAVGTTGLTNNQPLMLHWDGVTWTNVSGPPAPYASELSGVSGVAGDDVWAVGSSGGSSPATLAEHWNGSRWQIVPVPQGPTGSGALNSVVARASGDVWAVGYGVAFPAGISLTEHWNGAAWQVVPSPNPNPQGVNSLTAVTADVGSDTLWAVGGQLSTAFLIEEWTSGEWQTVHTPIPPGATGYLYGVAVTPGGDVWVVGAAGLTMVHTGPVTRVGLACPPT